MKAVLIGALAATALAADVIVPEGTYKVITTDGTEKAKCCFPDNNDVKVTKDGTNYQVSWKFPAVCPTESDAAKGLTITGVKNPVTSNAITFNDQPTTASPPGLGKSWKLTVPTAANGDFVLDLASSIPTGTNDCTATLEKVASTLPPSYSGVYEVKGKNGATPATCCYPDGDVIVRQPGAATTTVSASWTYAAVGTNCPTGSALAGTPKTVTATPNADTGSVPLSDGTNTYALSYAPNIAAAVLLDLGVTPNPTDCAVSLEKRTLPTTSPVNVYEVSDPTGTDANCCYPIGDVVVTADGTSKYKLEWTFGAEAGCGDLKNQKISASGIPDVATKDVNIQQVVNGQTYDFTLDFPTLNTDKFKLDLTDIHSTCGVTLEKKSGYLVGLGSLVALSLSYLMF